MPPSPEDAFHDCFQRLGYRGRHDLKRLQPSLKEQLQGLQRMFNETLRNQKKVAIHAECPPFHFDFIDADDNDENAIATRNDFYSFIGVTVPLIFRISDACVNLSRAAGLTAVLRVQPSEQDYNELQTTLFYVLLSFIVGHEWTHHVHGHLSTGAVVLRELVTDDLAESMDYQVKELAADGYSAYHTLRNLADNWTTFLPFLKFHGSTTPEVLDETFLACFIVAIAGYMFLWPVPDVNATDIYKLSHPPQAARLNFLMHEVIGWCRQNRPRMEEWIERQFQTLMQVTAEAVLGRGGSVVWAKQTRFFRSPDGTAYVAELGRRIDEYRKALGANRR
ncbi:MAG TPA: hypothetical protein VMJ34_17715 [Bryobacteraceae bacterium]|nr:hypothetical protein [Bryobacteraceae bacterium]